MIRAFAALALIVVPAAALAQPAPRFEVADIHRSAPGMNPYTYLSGGILRGERYDIRKATMLDLIRVAWNVDAETIVGGPNWLEFDRFDIAAKAPASSPPATVRLMLERLLEDRFKLALHRDMRPMPAFALAMGKGKPKLQESTGAATPECRYQQQPGGSGFDAGYSCRNMTMQAFAERLHQMAGDYLIDPVTNATGLDGAWDFDLQWNERSQALPAGAARTTIFDAVDKQLGLVLTPREILKPVLVIDRVNEKPTDNLPGIAEKLPPRVVEFEVADLKPSRPGAPGGGMRVTPGGGLEARAMDMRILMAAAWDVDWNHLERFAGLPKWVESARFDINARASTSTNAPPVLGPGYIDDDVRLMLRALLIDRFKIKFHYENRLLDGWTLAPGKPKMKKGDSSKRAGCTEARTIANDPRDVNPKLARLIRCQNTSMAQLAVKLQELAPDDFAYPVEDATGLSGGWDFMLSFSPPWMLNAPGSEPAAAAEGAEPNGALSLVDAIHKQLGLKLEKRRRMLPIIVIDQMNETPEAN